MKYKMNVNIGRLDQLIRIILSFGLIYAGFIDETIIADPISSSIIGYFGAAMMFIAVVRVCPMYAFVGINTCACHRNEIEKD